jgi:hypothetical protein
MSSYPSCPSLCPVRLVLLSRNSPLFLVSGIEEKGKKIPGTETAAPSLISCVYGRKAASVHIYRDPGDPFHHPHYCQKGEHHHPPIIFIPFAPPASSTHFLNMILWRSNFVVILFYRAVSRSCFTVWRQLDRKYLNCVRRNPPNLLDQKCASYL